MMVSRTVAQVLLAAILLFSLMPTADAQPNWTTAWSAQWIADPDAPPSEAGVFQFRRDFVLEQTPQSFPVRVSADNRYRLFVNGVEVSNGPARGDLLNWRYETVDLARWLRKGPNTLAATVWNFGDLRPSAQISLRTGFLLEAEDKAQATVNTGPQWRVRRNQAYSFEPVTGEDSGGYYVAGPRERLDARQFPWDWQESDLTTSGWRSAKPIGPGISKGTPPFGLAESWQLVPRSIPPMEQRLDRFLAVRRASGVSIPAGFVAGKSDIVIPANSRVSVLLDTGRITMGHPVLVTSGGAGATATMIFAESLFDARGQKGNRDEVDGKTIRGVRDSITFDGGDGRHFQSLWLRAFRYVQLEVETSNQPLRVSDFHFLFTGYPFQMRASFSSDAPWLSQVWDLNWNALRLASFETFWDTPYYEQLQYIGDTRIESLLSVYLTGDDRLMRNAIQQFADSRTPDGLTLSSFPSHRPQRIPSFSLTWVTMVHDYWMLRDDPAFVRSFLPTIRSVIDWHEGHIDETGLLGPMPWWNFLDWGSSYVDGVPLGARSGHATAFSFQFAIVLRQAAELEDRFGRQSQGDHYRALADRLVTAARARSWDDERQLFADAPEERVFSQQTNTLAILANAVPSQLRRSVMERILTDKSLGQASFYFRFYVDEAMRDSGMGGGYIERLEPWREMVRNGLTATAENPEPTRSDSHAWSAHPSYHLLASVLGVRSAESGFKRVAVEPELGSLNRAQGRIPHPAGTIEVYLERTRKFDGLAARVTLPAGVPGEFRWNGRTIPLNPGRNVLSCMVDCQLQPR